VRVGTGPGATPIFDQDCVDPVYRCRHGGVIDPGVDGGCTAITGGQIVDSCDWPAEFRGRYVFGDSSTDRIWTIQPNAARDGIVGGRADFATLDNAPIAIRTGPDGALYVGTFSGRIARIAPKAELPCTGTTSTTTTTAASTTTTTFPTTGPCAGLAGLELASCLLEAGDEPLCSADQVDERVGRAVAARLARAADFVARARTATKPRAIRRLLGRADRTLGAILRIVQRADRRSRITPECRDAVEAFVAALRAALAT
jgi:hypothetical protein